MTDNVQAMYDAAEEKAEEKLRDLDIDLPYVAATGVLEAISFTSIARELIQARERIAELEQGSIRRVEGHLLPMIDVIYNPDESQEYTRFVPMTEFAKQAAKATSVRSELTNAREHIHQLRNALRRLASNESFGQPFVIAHANPEQATMWDNHQAHKELKKRLDYAKQILNSEPEQTLVQYPLITSAPISLDDE